MTKIAIIIPYKENYCKKNAGAVSLWVKDYLTYSNTSKFTNVFGNLDDNLKPYSSNFINIKIQSNLNKNLNYINEIKKIILKNKEYSTIEIHNRPQYLKAFKELKKIIKIVVFHNNPLDLRGSQTKSQRLNILQIADHLIFVSEWCKNKFFEDLDKKDSYKCKIVYPGIHITENKIAKKEKIIFFSGKLNSAKGYDIFGSSIIEVLNQNLNWKAIVAGNESREKYHFKHPRLKIFDWLSHDKILNIYKKSSISVVCSKWDEPFGRTAMESSNYGCLTIISGKGGLAETSFTPVILKELTVKNLIKTINFYIKNKILLRKAQIKNFNNKKILLKNEVNKIDLIKNFHPYLYNYTKNIPLRILHISSFDEKNNYRLFNISISNKLSNGFIKNNHNVVNFCYRNFYNKNRYNLAREDMDKKILEINVNYRPNLILFGHFNELKMETIDQLKRRYKSNILGVFNLLESIRNYNKKIKLIHISTDEVYGDIKKKYKSKEEDAYCPSSPYSASKASGDLLIKSYIRTYKIPAIITNCCNNFGPNQYPEKLIPTIIYNILNKKPIPIYGKGRNEREWIYVKDHCNALIQVAEKGIIGENYNIGSGVVLNNIQITKKIRRRKKEASGG